jgi:hypothetical protein
MTRRCLPAFLAARSEMRERLGDGGAGDGHGMDDAGS